MAKITPGNKLYLYQLFAREIGVGRQELLPSYAEVLEAADVWLEDFEAETLVELLGACSEFIKLTTFKKGRVYATVLRNEEWDRWLAPGKDAEPAGGGAGKAGGKKPAGKPWKAKGAVAKNKQLKPVKPRHKAARSVKEPKAEEAAEARAEEAAGSKPETVAEAKSAEPVPAKALAVEAAVEPVTAEALPAEPVPAEAVPAKMTSAEGSMPAGTVPTEPAASVEPVPADATAFPARRTLAEQIEAEAARLAAEEPGDTALTPQESQTSDKAEAPKVVRRVGRFASALAQNQTVNQPQVEAVRDASVAEPPAARPSAPKNTEFPESFGADVHCKDELLRQLYQALPLDADLMAVLDEDWRVARSTGTLSGSRTKVTFPLRYLHDDGTPVRVTLRRASRPVAGKRWNLAYVDGDDGSGQALAASGIEGLPRADEGAWYDLSAAASRFVEASPVRELAQFAVLGSWDAVLGSLAAMAAPERWNYPGEGVGMGSRYGVLREYLTCTFFRARAQGRIAEDAERSFAAFNTGLLTPFGQDIFACFTGRRGDIAWGFAGFATAGSGELGGELLARLAQLPEAPSYFSSLADIVPGRERMVILDTETLLGRQLGMLPKAFLQEQLEGNRIAAEVLDQELSEAGSQGMDAEALTLIGRTIKADPGLYRRMARALDDALQVSLRHAQASYRSVVPVYDPASDSVKQLLPLSLVNDAHVDCAIVLAPQPSGNTRATGLMSLPRAYACARVISAEQPKWLAAEVVLK